MENSDASASTTHQEQALTEDVNLDSSLEKNQQPQNEDTQEEKKDDKIEYHDSHQVVYPPVFKSSSIPQPEQVRNYLQGLLTGDPYNKFCVDCHHNLSTYACLTYGIFVCGNCANVHKITFGGRSRSGIKDVYNEHWDDFQLEAISAGYGGNKAFFNFIQEYGIHSMPIDKKYKTDQVIFYMRRLAAKLDRREFHENPPAKDWDERLERAKSAVVSLLNKGEKRINEVGEKIDRDIEQKGWRTKISGFFKEKFSKKEKSLSASGAVGDAVKDSDQRVATEEENVYERDIREEQLTKQILLEEDDQGKIEVDNKEAEVKETIEAKKEEEVPAEQKNE